MFSGDWGPDMGDEGNDIEENSIDCSSSKLAIFITRLNFKQSDMRFSNAYDHFLINPFPVSTNYCSRVRQFAKNNVQSSFCR